MLENKLGITDSTELARAEEKISKQKALEMSESGFFEGFGSRISDRIVGLDMVGRKHDFEKESRQGDQMTETHSTHTLMKKILLALTAAAVLCSCSHKIGRAHV